MITLIAIKSPFQPIASRTTHEVEWHEGMTLANVLAAAGVPILRHSCVVEGLAVPEEMLAGFPATDGMTVIAMPSVAGGSYTKMFAELAVIAAATVITGGLATGPLAALGAGGLGSFFASVGLGTLSAGTASLIGAAVAIGGNLLINAFLGGSGGGGSDSSNFDPTGPKTVASGGTAIPKGYGTFLSGGNIIASYVEIEGVNNYANVLVCYGWGPALSITDLSINNNSIQNYQGVTYSNRLGTNTQTPISNFNNIVNGYPQDIRCIAPAGGGFPVIIQGTGTDTQGLQVVIQFPDGIFYSNDDGSLRSLSVTYQIQYAVSGTGNWQNPVMPDQTHDIVSYTSNGVVSSYPQWVVVPNNTDYSSGIVYAYDNGPHTPGDPWSGTATVTYIGPDGSESHGPISLTGEWQLCDPNLNQQAVDTWFAGWCFVTECTQSTYYRTTSIFNLPPNKYDVKVTKYGAAFAGDPVQPLEADNNRTGDQVWVHTINEVQYQDLAYPNMVLCGVRALGTNQLSGNNINITALVDYGITVQLPYELLSYGLDNPAVVAYDMLVADFYGGSVNPDNIDVPAFAAWAAYNDELVSDGFDGTIKRHVFNGVFDAKGTNLWKSLQKVAMMAQASIIQEGMDYTVVVDMPVTVPAQVFTSGNVIKDSIKDTWLSFDDRANRIEVTFADAARNYRTDEPCGVMLPSDIQTGVEVKTTRVELLGCTNRAQAWHWAYRKLLSTDLLLLTRSFDVGIEAVACRVGSVIGVQDDITLWAYGGRIQAGSTATSLLVDVDALPYTAGEGWTVSIVHPVLVRGTATILSVIGTLLTFTANLPAGNIASVETPNGATTTAVQGIGTNTLTVTNPANFAAGQVITLIDQDVVDTQPVSASASGVLTPYAPFLQAPTQDCPWVYGQSAGAFPAKLFTVTNIRKKGDLNVTIDCLEYNAAVYADDTPLITETLGTPVVNAAVTSLTAVEHYGLLAGANGGQASQIALGWVNGPNTDSVQLWVAMNDANQPLSAESVWQTVAGGTTAVLTAPTGAILQIRAVGVSASGVTAPFATAPIVTITVQGSGLAPGDVPNFGGQSSSAGSALVWSAAANAANYEIRYNADPGNTNWLTAVLLYSGGALNWTDATVRQGNYLIKALSSDSVESVNAASWNYLQSTNRLNLIGLEPNQSIDVTVTQNELITVGSTTIALTLTAQTLYRTDGSPIMVPAQTLTWTGLTPGASYIFYLYLAPASFAFSCVPAPNTAPPTTTNLTDAATAAANGNYPLAPLTVVADSIGSDASLQVNMAQWTGHSDAISSPPYVVMSIDVNGGGTGYGSPSATLSGQAVQTDGTLYAATDGVSLTVVSGVITAASNGGGILWTGTPDITITR